MRTAIFIDSSTLKHMLYRLFILSCLCLVGCGSSQPTQSGPSAPSPASPTAQLPQSPPPVSPTAQLRQSPLPESKPAQLPQSPPPVPPTAQLRQSPLPESPRPLPRPNPEGDFAGKLDHRRWIVVDPDPNGLNCRWSREVPQEWYSPNAVWPPRRFQSWSVVKRLASSSPIVANGGPAGFVTIADERGLPWLKVSLDDRSDSICLVRANNRFIQPVP